MKKSGAKIIILGAGLAGMACACRLTELGHHDIIIIEKESRPGGLAVSLELDGHTADLGPHRIHSEIDKVLTFLKNWVSGELIRCSRKSRMWLDGRFIDYPPTVMDTLKHFGPLRLAGFMFDLLAARFSSEETRNYETVMKKAFGKGLYEAIIKPYTEKTWGMKASELSAEVAKARVSAGGVGALVKRLFLPEKKGKETSLKEFLYTRGGINTLSGALFDQLSRKGVRFLFDSEVTGFKADNDGTCTIRINENGERSTISGDFCFSTIPLDELARFIMSESKHSKALTSAQNLDFLSMILVFVRIRKPLISGDTWLYFPGKNLIFNRGYESKSFDPSLGPSGESMICLEITCRKGDSLWKANDEETASRVCEDLVKTGLVSREEIIQFYTTRITHAYPVYSRGYRERLQKIWAALKEYPGLITLGRQGLYHHNNMDHSIYEGLLAAEYYVQKEKPCIRWYEDAGQFRNLRIVD